MVCLYKDFAEIQNQLRNFLAQRSRPTISSISFVGGADVAYFTLPKGECFALACLAVFSYPSMKLVESAIGIAPAMIPYVPGFLSFREIPSLLEAHEKLRVLPEIWLVDGAGEAHPRRFGLACHFASLTGTPTVGVAKKRLIGNHGEVGMEKGAQVPLRGKGGEIIGMVLRSRHKVRPLYLSVGWGISLDAAVSLVLSCCLRYRLPEPTHWADKLGRKAKKEYLSKEMCSCDH